MGILLRKPEVDCFGVLMIVKILVHEHYVKSSLIMYNIKGSLVNQVKSVFKSKSNTFSRLVIEILLDSARQFYRKV